MTFVPLAYMLWASNAQAQVAIVHQPDPAAWYAEATGLLESRGIAAADLPNLKAGAVPASLAADLGAFDWLEAGSYSYTDKTVDVAYGAKHPCQVNIRRYQADGGELRFGYVAPCDQVTAGQIVHLNFVSPPVTATTVVTANGSTWLRSVSYGEASSNRVISYGNGVLVVDVSRDGKQGSRPGLRLVYVAMPKRFEWKYAETP